MTELDVVTLQQAKDYLKVDFNDDDDLITSLIIGAIGMVERFTMYRLWQRSEAIQTSKNQYEAYQYPITAIAISSIDQSSPPVSVSVVPFQYLIGSLKTTYCFGNLNQNYFDNLSSAEYPAYGGFVPFSYNLTTYTLTFTVGYSDVSKIPNAIITAVKQLITFMYEQRDLSSDQMPNNIMLLLSAYRRYVYI